MKRTIQQYIPAKCVPIVCSILSSKEIQHVNEDVWLYGKPFSPKNVAQILAQQYFTLRIGIITTCSVKLKSTVIQTDPILCSCSIVSLNVRHFNDVIQNIQSVSHFTVHPVKHNILVIWYELNNMFWSKRPSSDTQEWKIDIQIIMEIEISVSYIGIYTWCSRKT